MMDEYLETRHMGAANTTPAFRKLPHRYLGSTTGGEFPMLGVYGMGI